MGGDQGSMAYWSDGSAALVVTSAVLATGLTADDLYGDGRMKFLPAALLNLAGPLAVPPYLTGEMPGDVGWDPLQMGGAARYREASRARAHPRTVGDARGDWRARARVHRQAVIFGSPGQHWWNTAVTWPEGAPIPELTPISGRPSRGVWRGFPSFTSRCFSSRSCSARGGTSWRRLKTSTGCTRGEKLFDPLDIGKSVGDEDLNILKTIEIRHCRLAMIASFGFIVEAVGWGAGPLDFLP